MLLPCLCLGFARLNSTHKHGCGSARYPCRLQSVKARFTEKEGEAQTAKNGNGHAGWNPSTRPYTGPSRKSAARSKLYQPLLASITKGRTSARRARVRIALFLDGGTGRIDGKGTREPPCGRDGKAEASKARAPNLDLFAMKPRAGSAGWDACHYHPFHAHGVASRRNKIIGDSHGQRCIVAA